MQVVHVVAEKVFLFKYINFEDEKGHYAPFFVQFASINFRLHNYSETFIIALPN